MSSRVEEEGVGGGLGRYPGLTLSEISIRFATCVASPSMRSATAVLRITREQLMARGHLGDYPKIGLGLAVATGVLLIAAEFLPGPLKAQIRLTALGFGFATLAVGYGVWTTRHERRAGRFQEREIRRLATEALTEILRHDFPRKPLLREQEQTLSDLVRHHPTPALIQLLRSE